MKKKSNVISTIILTIMLFVGLAVMLYPTISDWWNSRVQSRAIANYNEIIAEMDDDQTQNLIQQARDYNEKLFNTYLPIVNTDEVEGYDDILNISDTHIMGYISIPVINVELPIYHGTSAEVLNIAAGHLKGSSFPVGGNNTHAVISAHRGLPSAKLFTDLDKLVVGDTFTINILGEVYTYEIEEILIIEPDEIENLAIFPNNDYVTLMTCTPYGVNTHRLLLRSHRIETQQVYDVKVTADATQVDPMIVVPVMALPFLIILICFWVISGKKKNKVSGEQAFNSIIKK